MSKENPKDKIGQTVDYIEFVKKGYTWLDVDTVYDYYEDGRYLTTLFGLYVETSPEGEDTKYRFETAGEWGKKNGVVQVEKIKIIDVQTQKEILIERLEKALKYAR